MINNASTVRNSCDGRVSRYLRQFSSSFQHTFWTKSSPPSTASVPSPLKPAYINRMYCSSAIACHEAISQSIVALQFTTLEAHVCAENEEVVRRPTQHTQLLVFPSILVRLKAMVAPAEHGQGLDRSKEHTNNGYRYSGSIHLIVQRMSGTPDVSGRKRLQPNIAAEKSVIVPVYHL